MTAKSARLLAVRCLVETSRGGYSNLVFKELAGSAGLSPDDAAFAAAIFYGALERKITLDYILGQYTRINKLDAEVLAVLESGLYQALYLNSVPAFASVNESVKLCKSVKKSSASGLVNAVLRRACEFDAAALESAPLKYSLSEPLTALILEQYGERAQGIFEGFFGKKRSYIRVNSLKTTAENAALSLKTKGVETLETPLEGALEITSGTVVGTSEMTDGLVRIQSLTAQLASAALGARAGDVVIDFCAAPGGKALTTAQRMKNEGRIICLDRSESRLKLLSERAAAEGITITSCTAADSSSELREYEGVADRALCDVPCSGFGEIASKPELRQKSPEPDGAELFKIQRRILENGARSLKPGGRLVYSTCTLDRRENEDICGAFLSEHRDFRAIIPELPLPDGVAGEKYIKFLPDSASSEGFYIATFERMC